MAQDTTGLVPIGSIRGPAGPAGSVSAGDFVSIPAGEQGKVVTRKVGEITLLDVYQPRGLPGVNAVPADNAVATYSTAQGSATNTALRSFLLPRAEVASTIAPLVATAGPVRDALRAQFPRASILGVGANTAPLIEWTGIAGAVAGFHMSTGPGFKGPYMMGLGNDFEDRAALWIANKAAGVGLVINNHDTATEVGMRGFQSSAASLMDLVSNVNAGGAMIVARVNNGIANPGSLAAFYASTGESFNIRGTGDVDVRQRLRVLGNDGGPAAEILVQSAPATPSSQANGAWLSQNAHTFAAASGSDGAFFKTRIAAVGDRLRLQAGGGGGFSASAPSWSDIVAITSDSKLGFFGATPVARPAISNDTASIRAALIALGLGTPA